MIAYILVLVRFPLPKGDLAIYSQDKANIMSLGFLVGIGLCPAVVIGL